MALPSSGPISVGEIQTEFGGVSPASLSEYYAGGLYVPSGTLNGSGSPIPTSGVISVNDFYGAKNWVRSYAQLGDGNGYGSGSALCYGAHTVSGGSVGMPGWTWIYASDTSSYKYQVYCAGNTYFPMLTSLQNNYGMGTGDVSPYYTLSDVPLFVWKNQYSNWTSDMIRNELGLTATQASAVNIAAQVWWENGYAGMDNTLYYGLAILDSRNYNAGSLGNAWNNKTVVQYFYNYDYGGEWSSHGFTFAPTVSGGYVTGNTGVGAFTKTGATYRDGGGVIGSLSDYTVTLDNYSLVVPVVGSDNGFSGGARNGNREPFMAKFGYILLS